MLRLASEIAGRPVDFEEAGIDVFSVLIELAAFFAHRRKKWVLIGAVGRQIGICSDDGTVSWDVDNDGQRYPGSRYFKAKLPRDADVPSLRGVMDIVRDPATKAMIVGDETLEQAWRAVVEDDYDLNDRDKASRIWAAIDDRNDSAAAEALSSKSGAFLKSDGNGGLKSMVVAFAGSTTGGKTKSGNKRQWYTETFKEVAQTAADDGASRASRS